MNKRFLPKKINLIISLALLCSIIFISGYVYYNYEKSSIINNKYRELKNISDFKTKQLYGFIKEQKAILNIVSSSEFFINGIEEFIQSPSDVNLRIDIVDHLRTIIESYKFQNIILTDEAGELLLTLKPGVKELSEFTISKVYKAVSNKKIVLSDLYFCKIHNDIHMDFIATVINKRSEVIAALIFRVNPQDELFHLLQYYPKSSYSLETILLRKEADNVLFIGETKFGNNTAFNLKIPLTSKEVPSVQAAMGLVGKFEGKDYRGIEVLSDIRRLTDPEWIMVTKIDKSEINAALLNKVYYILALCFGLICTVGFVFIWFYNNRQKNIYVELYKKEKELWQHQEKFEVTLDGLGDGIIITDLKGFVTYLNKKAEELTGWNLREAQGRKLTEIYSVKNEHTGQKENNILEKVIKQGLVKELANHTLLINKDGKEIPVMDTGAPIFDIDGTLHSIAISFQDETEKRERLNLVKQSENRLRSTLDNMLEGCQIIGFDWRDQYLNKAAEKHNRHSNSELLGKIYMEMWPGIEDTEIFKIIKRCMDERIPQSLENEFTFPDGSKGCFQLSIEPIPEGVFILSVDITERKKIELEMLKTEEELRKSNEKINRIITDLKDLYWTASIDGSKLFEINEALSNFYGVTIEEFKANPKLWIEMVHPDDKEIALKSAEMLNINGKAEAEYRIVRPDGTIKWIMDRKSIIKDKEGNPIQIGGLAKDITERKLAEKEIIKAKEKAEEMNRLRTNFFANMSHELRTPFVGIIGYAEILAENLQNTENGEFADAILESSQRMIRTLNQILSTSKLEFEERKLQRSTVDLETLLMEVFNNFSKMAEKKNLEYKKDIRFRNHLTVTDEELLEQILSNLISNAIKFTKAGSVNIFADIILKNNNDILIVEVKDTGIGIAKNQQEIIWEQFRQASEGLNRSFEGTGLGLSIVKSNTELLEGSISVESEEGKGSTFILEIPLTESNDFQSEIDEADKIPNGTLISTKEDNDDRKKYYLLRMISLLGML